MIDTQPDVGAARDQIRAELPAHFERLRNTLSLAVAALDGPDPEAALGFLAVLDEHIHGVPGIGAAINALQREASEARPS